MEQWNRAHARSLRRRKIRNPDLRLKCCNAASWQPSSDPPGTPETWGRPLSCARMHGGQGEIAPQFGSKGAFGPTFLPYVEGWGHLPHRFCAKLSNNALCAPRGTTPHRRRTRSENRPKGCIPSITFQDSRCHFDCGLPSPRFHTESFCGWCQPRLTSRMRTRKKAMRHRWHG